MKFIYPKEYLEQQADEINRKFYPERLIKIIKLDVYDLLEKLGLDVEWKYISPNDNILGMIFFEDGCWYIWPNSDFKEEDKPRKEYFKKNTIVINQRLLDKNEVEREIFVCNHETMHSVKDKAFFRSRDIKELHICRENDFSKTYWYEGMSLLDIVERQTNYLNAAVLMPRDILKQEFFKRLRYKNIPNQPIEYKKYMSKCIKSLADDFGLNYNPVLYRLYDLNILKRKENIQS